MVSVRELQQLDPQEFEEFVAKIWKANGYDTQITQGSNDRGVDIRATKGDEKHIIQAKRYSGNNKVGRPDIQQYHSLYQQEGASAVFLVTTGEFTSEAIQSANELGVIGIDGPGLVDMVNDGFSFQGNESPEVPTERAAKSSTSAVTSIFLLGATTSLSFLSLLPAVLRGGGLKLLYYAYNAFFIGFGVLYCILLLYYGIDIPVAALVMMLGLVLAIGASIYYPSRYVLRVTAASE